MTTTFLTPDFLNRLADARSEYTGDERIMAEVELLRSLVRVMNGQTTTDAFVVAFTPSWTWASFPEFAGRSGRNEARSDA